MRDVHTTPSGGRGAVNPGRRVVVVAAVVVAAVVFGVFVGVAPVAAQDTGDGEAEPVNATEAGIDADQIEGQLANVDVLRVDFTDGSNLVQIYVDVEPGADPIAVTDSGAVDIGSDERANVPFEVYRGLEPGTHELRFYLSSDDQLITIQEGEEMMAASGDRGVIDVMTSAPRSQQLIWMLLSGVGGTVIAAAFSVGTLKRRHENTYKELLSEERVRVEEDPVDGVLGKLKRWVIHNRRALALIAVVLLYIILSRLGVIPTIGDLWATASDTQRIVSLGIVAAVIIGIIPVHLVIKRVWEPAKEFVIDTDARDVIDGALGAKGGLAALEDVEEADDIDDAVEALDEQDITVTAVYSGSPDRIAQLRCEGEPAELQTPGGRGYLVQSFDPKRNRAEGVWPGLADDFELARERSKIDSNREILEDYATVGRRIIGALPAIRAGADTAAVTAVDRKFAQAASIDSDPVDDIIDSAVNGTRFERYYSKGRETESNDGEEYSDEDEDDETVNTDGDDE